MPRRRDPESGSPASEMGTSEGRDSFGGDGSLAGSSRGRNFLAGSQAAAKAGVGKRSCRRR